MKLVPTSFTGQLTALLVLALLAAQAGAFILFAGERLQIARQIYQETVVERAITLRRLLADVPAPLHQGVLDAASNRFVRFSVSPEPEAEEGTDPAARFMAANLDLALGLSSGSARVSIGFDEERGPPEGRRGWFGEPGEAPRPGDAPPPPPRDWLKASVPLEGGGWLNIGTGPPPGPRPIRRTLIVSLVLSTIATLIVAVFVAGRIVRPMKRIAEAADRVGRGEATGPLPETGPDEARMSARAFNQMRERLDRFVRDRTQMLAAISHDLRTPITSLRLRAEMVEDEETREKLIATLEEMQGMTEATLAFVRADQTEEQTRPVDLAALVDSLAADLVEIGLDVSVHEAARPIVRGRTVALRRALRNLVENAVRYGLRARITVDVATTGEGSEARIVVEDDGPGLPPGELEKVFEPFVRGEVSRSRETGGIGLGLAIARSVLRSHGGDVRLENRDGGGLRAVVTLPA